jgi:hypothetical protein
MTMRVVTCLLLFCDQCGQPLGDDSVDMHFQAVPGMETAARDLGWTTDGAGRWHCPECPELVDEVTRKPVPEIDGQETLSPALGVDPLELALRRGGLRPLGHLTHP